MSVHLKIEESTEGLVAALSQRDGDGKLIGDPSVGLVGSAAEAKQRAKTLAQSLGLKVYGFTVSLPQRNSLPVPKNRHKPLPTRDGGGRSNATGGRPPWLVPGVGGSI